MIYTIAKPNNIDQDDPVLPTLYKIFKVFYFSLASAIDYLAEEYEEEGIVWNRMMCKEFLDDAIRDGRIVEYVVPYEMEDYEQ